MLYFCFKGFILGLITNQRTKCDSVSKKKLIEANLGFQKQKSDATSLVNYPPDSSGELFAKHNFNEKLSPHSKNRTQRLPFILISSPYAVAHKFTSKLSIK